MINYAPLIDTSVPGFLLETRLKAKNIKINFKHNIAVSKNDVKKMKVIFKPYRQNAQTSSIAEISIINNVNNSYFDLDQGFIFIDDLIVNEGSLFTEGVYYKIQIAYIDQYDNLGPYSSIGIARCLGQRGNTKIFVDNLKEDGFNAPQKKYIGYFNYDTSITEVVYQYRFILSEKDNEKVIKKTDWLIPEYDQMNRPIMIFNVLEELEIDKEYNLYFEITTINGYSESINYTIYGNVREYPPIYLDSLEAYQGAEEIENGYITIQLNSQGNDVPNGKFVLIRKEIDSKVWNQLTTFELTKNTDLNKVNWKDFSIEAGKIYIYAIQQICEELVTKQLIYSDKIVATKPVIAEFENMFLSDGIKQLKIGFNPKVSSFKTVIVENKTETLGSKYPFFSRTGSSAYKEIPIAGLLSYHMDPDFLFLTQNELGLNHKEKQRKTTPDQQMIIENNIKINLLDPNHPNQNLVYYTANVLNNISVDFYKFFLYEKDNEQVNLINSAWSRPQFDINGKPIINFILEYELDKNKEYWLKVQILHDKQDNLIESLSYPIVHQMAQIPEINLTNSNFKLEKDFKILVYDWLTDGKPKFFRSPTEGNYILRLMDVSLSPEEGLGRMLHNFNATGYEMAENSFEKLQELSLISFNEIDLNTTKIKNNKEIIEKFLINPVIDGENTIKIPILIKDKNAEIIFNFSNGVIPNNFNINIKNGEPYAQTSYEITKTITETNFTLAKLLEDNENFFEQAKVYSLLINPTSLSEGYAISIKYTLPEETYLYNQFDTIVKYSKIKSITLNGNEWDNLFNISRETEIENGTLQQNMYKQLERLYKIEKIEKTEPNADASCILYFSDGTKRVYNEQELLTLHNFDNLVKIKPNSENISITFLGLVSYATSPRLGRFELNNSRIGDEYING